MKLVFLLEESSMKYLLDELLPQIIPHQIAYQTIPHNGKSDLERSLPRKLKAWNEPDVHFVVVHDQDNKNCIELKENLRQLCADSGRPVLIRIACQELEAWYFGDFPALISAYGSNGSKRLIDLSRKRKYQVPDNIQNPKEELYRIIPSFQQIAGAKRVAPLMNIDHNTSTSFNAFINGVKRFSVLQISQESLDRQ